MWRGGGGEGQRDARRVAMARWTRGGEWRAPQIVGGDQTEANARPRATRASDRASARPPRFATLRKPYISRAGSDAAETWRGRDVAAARGARRDRKHSGDACERPRRRLPGVSGVAFLGHGGPGSLPRSRPDPKEKPESRTTTRFARGIDRGERATPPHDARVERAMVGGYAPMMSNACF